MVYPYTKEHLTENDLKVLKHLKSIDNLFKRGNISISLFCDNGTVKVLKSVDEQDYEIDSFFHIVCDGGDPDGHGYLGIGTAEELEEYYEKLDI